MLYVTHKSVPESVAAKFRISLTKHIFFVQQAAEILGIPQEWVANHDASKYAPAEFSAYSRQFYGDKNDPEGFALAWLHHIHNNPHHWQYWMFPDGWRFGSINAVMPMPKRYYMEMIADWMGASMAYTNSWDMTKWLSENMGKITLHPQTATNVRVELDKLGYTDVVNSHTFKNELVEAL